MTKKELVSKVAARTGFSESHVSKVLSGSRTNAEITACANEIENGVTTKAVVKTSKKKDVVPVASKELNEQFDKNSSIKRFKTSDIGGILRQARENRGMSKEDVADAMNEDEDTISNIENDATECTLEQFFGYFLACRVQVDFRLIYV